ncbi:MAG TPA: 30S ribosomal protein S9 [Bacteroidia bacterium]|nr:30S ribosomal protein S9 [Bacteroidia bacterium]HNT80510.1 30S ribosomal protein S9 [Bacteroidia bacterium]
MEITHTIGRRKTSVARIYLSRGTGALTVNNRELQDYFPTTALQYISKQSFIETETVDQYDVKANVTGGGINGQAEAIRLAIARALVKIDENYKGALKAKGLLTRDPRMVERKKSGQKKARKRFQFSKR